MGIKPRIIYCGRSNNTLDRIAIYSGFEYGLRLPFTANFPPIFADQDWKKPNKEKYIESVAQHKPEMATVLDWEHQEQKGEVFDWIDDISKYVQVIIVIPKFSSAIRQIPLSWEGKEVRLGYSVPSGYGKTSVKIEEFNTTHHRVHLLGGTPHLQIMLARCMNVTSVDCNSHSLYANDYCEAWTGKMIKGSRMRVRMQDIGIEGDNANKIAFAMSCANIMRAWSLVAQGEVLPFEKERRYQKALTLL